MKILKYNIGICLIILAASISAHSLTIRDDQDFQKNIDKTFNIDPNGSVEIDNRYGNIDITSWDQAIVKFEITIKTDARNKDKADKVLDKINIVFEQENDFVSASTVIESEDNSWWQSMWNGNNNEHMEIHYKVWIPKSCRPNVKNKYGNINLTDMSTDVRAYVKYGNFEAESIKGNLNLEIKYGNAAVYTCQNIALQIGYGKFVATSVENASIESKYSNLRIEKANDLNITAKYDTYRLGEVGNVIYNGKYDDIDIDEAAIADISTKYTGLKIGLLHKELSLSCKYGSLKLNSVGPMFKKAQLNCRYTPVKLVIDKPFNIVADTKNTDIDLPDAIRLDSVNKDGSTYDFRGTYQNGSNGIEIISNMSYGSLTIRN